MTDTEPAPAEDSPSQRQLDADQSVLGKSEPPVGDSDAAAGIVPAASEREASAESDTAESDKDESKTAKRAVLWELVRLLVLAIVIYYGMLTFVARPYLIPSESMEPTLHGCATCVGDRIMVDKLSYACVPFTDRQTCFGRPKPGDVIVFKGPPSWNVGYKSIRSDNTALRWVQNALSFIGFVPPDENDLVKRVIAVGGQTVACRADTGLTVNGKPLKEPYLDAATMMADPSVYPCLGSEFGPVTIPQGRLWVMGDNRTHSADSRAHCPMLCTGDPTAGTVPVENVIGKARFIVWPPSRWGGVGSVNPQTGQ